MSNVKTCITFIKEADQELYEHCERVSILAEEIGKELNISYDLKTAGLLHDIGKISMPKSILKKKGLLTPDERKLIDLHSYLGYCILDNYQIDKEICQLVLLHHGIHKERFGVEVKDVSIIHAAAVLQCVDAFDAITSKRIYSDAKSIDEAFEIMEKEDIFDKKILKNFEEIVEGINYGNRKKSYHR